jgi:hypothetical protein
MKCRHRASFAEAIAALLFRMLARFSILISLSRPPGLLFGTLPGGMQKLEI